MLFHYNATASHSLFHNPITKAKSVTKPQKQFITHCSILLYRGLGDTHRQARELISGPCLGAKAKFLSFIRTQSRAVTGLLTGHNTQRRHLHLMWLSDIPLCRRCGAEDETSVHILCECEALASLRHAYLGYFFLEPMDIKIMSLGGHLELQ